jgi:hypothetical protein
MSDINRGGNGYDLIQKIPALKAHHIRIQISEKENIIKQLAVRLEHINTVEIEQIKLQIATLTKEVEMLKDGLENSVIDAEVISN